MTRFIQIVFLHIWLSLRPGCWGQLISLLWHFPKGQPMVMVPPKDEPTMASNNLQFPSDSLTVFRVFHCFDSLQLSLQSANFLTAFIWLNYNCNCINMTVFNCLNSLQLYWQSTSFLYSLWLSWHSATFLTVLQLSWQSKLFLRGHDLCRIGPCFSSMLQT